MFDFFLFGSIRVYLDKEVEFVYSFQVIRRELLVRRFSSLICDFSFYLEVNLIVFIFKKKKKLIISYLVECVGYNQVYKDWGV